MRELVCSLGLSLSAKNAEKLRRRQRGLQKTVVPHTLTSLAESYLDVEINQFVPLLKHHEYVGDVETQRQHSDICVSISDYINRNTIQKKN
jgi:hypothetical protein